MATITAIKQRIEQLDAGSFQNLCDGYLSLEGFKNPVSLGTRTGTQKTTPGTPDTYFSYPNGKYVFVEYTTQIGSLTGKILDDLKKCLDSENTGISAEDIERIIYFHTSSNLSPGDDSTLKSYCHERGTELTLIGIDKLADDILRKYQSLAKDHLGLTIDTEQIQTPSEFIARYNSNKTVAPLDTKLISRDDELAKIDESFSQFDVVILSGPAGVGKTRLALLYIDKYQVQNPDAKIYVIHERGLPIFEDLCSYFEIPGTYFIFVDDANQLSQLSLVLEYLNKESKGYKVKILITVRQYALYKVKEDVIKFSRFGIVTIEGFSDTQIETLAKDAFGILNDDYQKRIVAIANGNIRLAVLACKVACESNRLSSISDATTLYDEYYGRTLSDTTITENKPMLITAGMMSFLGSFMIDDLINYIEIITDNQLTADEIHVCIRKLHELELVDVCRDKAVSFSDQCYSDYILKLVFIDKKAVSLSKATDVCFDVSRNRVIQAINHLFDLFRNTETHEFVSSEIKKVWNERKGRNNSEFWEWVKVFYIVNPEETLLLLRQRISSTEPVCIDISNLDTNTGKNYQRVDDDIINILGGFAHTAYIDTALNLFFLYFKRRPDLYIQFYHAINSFFSIDLNSIKDNYNTQFSLFETFSKYSDYWNDGFILTLYVDVIKDFTKLVFSYTEGDRSGKGFVVYTIPLPKSEYSISLRKTMWEMILSILNSKSGFFDIHDLLRSYPELSYERNGEMIGSDAPYVVRLLSSLSEENLLDCVFVEEICNRLRGMDFDDTGLVSFLNNPRLSLYHLLSGPTYNPETDFSKTEQNHIDDIQKYIAENDDYFSNFQAFWDIYTVCAKERQEIYSVGQSLTIAIIFILKQKVDLGPVLDTIMKSEYSTGLNTYTITSTLFELFDTEKVWSIVCSASDLSIDSWKYSFFHEIPAERINQFFTNELLEYLHKDFDRHLKESPLRDLRFLSKYEATDPKIWINASRIILDKKSYSDIAVSMYFNLLFNRYHLDTDYVFNKYNGDHNLLEDIYLFEILHDSNTDYDGSMLAKLTANNPVFFQRIICTEIEADHRVWEHSRERLQAIFTVPNYCDLLDSVFDYILSDSWQRYINGNGLLNVFVNVPKQYAENSATWVKHYIENNYDSLNIIEGLFESISQLDEDKRTNYILYLLEKTKDIDIFKSVRLYPMSASWSGSAIPIHTKWLNFVKNLKSKLAGVEYLEHNVYLNAVIEDLRKQIEYIEIEELLRG